MYSQFTNVCSSCTKGKAPQANDKCTDLVIISVIKASFNSAKCKGHDSRENFHIKITENPYQHFNRIKTRKATRSICNLTKICQVSSNFSQRK